MHITSDINLAFPIRSNDEGEALVWAYHTPISSLVFEANYRVIAATKAELFGKGNSYMASASQVAKFTLRDAARADALENGLITDLKEAASYQSPLLAEIERLTNVLVPTETGYDLLPIPAAIARKAIDQDDWAEAEGTLIFFTCGYAMAKRSNRMGLSLFMARAMKGSITSLPPMAFAASLKKSTPDEQIIDNAAASSVPS